MNGSPYAYVLQVEGQQPVVFTWPSTVKKYLRDVYAGEDGELKLPPPGYISLRRYRVNPQAGQLSMVVLIEDIGHFVTH